MDLKAHDCERSTPNPTTIVGLGEILWDNLPSVRTLGGAPANFAYMVNVLGDRGIIASRVGCDASGDELIEQMRRCGLSTSYIQRDPIYETGYSVVTLDLEGQASYRLAQPAAWDNLQWNKEWQNLAEQADAVCFGTLAQRSASSATAIAAFLEALPPGTLRVFDVNLRHPFISLDSILHSLDQADLVKMNAEELITIAGMLGYAGHPDPEKLALSIVHRFDLRLLCITRGAGGSLLVSRDDVIDCPSETVEVIDSIGTGDAFTACLVHHYLRGASLQHISEVSNRLAGWVATQTGATPDLPRDTLESLLLPRRVLDLSRSATA